MRSTCGLNEEIETTVCIQNICPDFFVFLTPLAALTSFAPTPMRTKPDGVVVRPNWLNSLMVQILYIRDKILDTDAHG